MVLAHLKVALALKDKVALPWAAKEDNLVDRVDNSVDRWEWDQWAKVECVTAAKVAGKQVKPLINLANNAEVVETDKQD